MIAPSGTSDNLRAFLNECALETLYLHLPIADLEAPGVLGHLNPKHLDDPQGVLTSHDTAQSSVGFRTLDALRKADMSGISPYGNGTGRNKSAEYAIVKTHQAGEACEKMTALHCTPEDIARGAGATIFPSGLNAINATLLALPHKHILMPKETYGPAQRFIRTFNEDAGVEAIKVSFYDSRASSGAVQEILDKAIADKNPVTMLYMEAPCSQSFGIADIGGIARLAKSYGIPSVIDNSWATHAIFTPLKPVELGGIGADVVIQATTKYEGGYYDLPSGFAIARDPKWVDAIAKRAKHYGFGVVHPDIPKQLLHRINDVEARLERHFENGLQISRWLQQQPFIKQVLNPALETSQDHERFKRFFGGKGNGLLTAVFRDDISREKADAFIDGLHLFIKAQSWGGHLSLVTDSPVAPVAFRFHAGMEDPRDLIRDMEQSAAKVFNYRPEQRAEWRPPVLAR